MRIRLFCCVILGGLCPSIVEAGAWPQFRGPNGSGTAVGAQALPADIGPDQNVLWKINLPSGHSSPVVVGDRVYLTAVRDRERIELLTIGLDQATGQVVWEAAAPYTELETVNSTLGSYAQSTCTANEECVVSFFGSAGLFCYERSGDLRWHREFETFKNDDGAGSSPILVGDRVILSQDHDVGSFLMAIRLSDGSSIWNTERPQFIRGYATPVIWHNNGERQVVVAGSLMVKGYDFDSGEEKWVVRGLSWGVVATPVLGSDGTLFVGSLAAGIMDVKGRAPKFDEVDTDKNGVLIQQEFRDGDALIGYFTHFDRNKDGEVVRSEYDAIVNYWETSRDVVLAIRPGGAGDITDSHVVWTSTRIVPSVPSPLFHDGRLFLVKDGGIVNWLDAKTGEAGKRRRISGRGDYFCSPVAGDGKIYMISHRGDLSVITAERNWREIATSSFEEPVFATPAIVDGRIYVRTASQLYCHGYGAPSHHVTYLRQTQQAKSQRLARIIIIACSAVFLAGAVGLVWRSRRRRGGG